MTKEEKSALRARKKQIEKEIQKLFKEYCDIQRKLTQEHANEKKEAAQ
jgi:hypothetical protein